MKFFIRFLLLSVIVVGFACSTPKNEALDTNRDYKFLALGDSYTIGEAVAVSDRWPVQLVDRLAEDSIHIELEIIARTGWTTDELISGIIKSDVEEGPYDLVTLLIGVNNQYRGYDENQYEKEFKSLLERSIEFAGGNSGHVIVVSIPDYGVTPFAAKQGLDPGTIAHELDSYNAIAQKISILRDVEFINITPISREAAQDSTLIATDGLHPSGKMYTRWVDVMYEKVYTHLSSIINY